MILAAKRDFMRVKIGSDFLFDSRFPLYWASLQFKNRSEERLLHIIFFHILR